MEEEAASSSNQTEETKPEVSLPGADVNSIDQPAILQVLSPLNATEDKHNKIEENPVQPDLLLKQPSSTKEPQSHNDDDVKQDHLKPSNINLVSSSNKSQSHLVITTPTPTPTPSPTKDCKFDPQTGEILFPDPSQNNILDIESHLIETYNELFPHEESVGINELPPIADELQVGCSKVETNDNVRTVIEVQPAEVITKKPIEKKIETDSPLQAAQATTVPTVLTNGETFVNKDEIERVAEKLIQDIEEEVQQLLAASKTEELNKNSKEEEAKEVKEVKEAKETKEVKEEKQAEEVKEPKEVKEVKEAKETKEVKEEKEVNKAKEVKETKEVIKAEEVKETKEVKEPKEVKEVKETEETKEVKEVKASKEVKEPKEVKEEKVENVNEFNEKTEGSDKYDTCKDDVSQSKLEERFESTESTTADEKLSEVVDQQLSEVNSILDSQVKKSDEKIKEQQRSNLKLISVPLIKTASEEEERKLFIESLPPLEANDTTQSDAEKLALDCKREYYQSLKKYLVQSSTDKPPVPLQTYRWEDLRRAKERGGYPWTHLYKRPLGPDEQPEIVLMLRKSQEIRFTSESPKSNKKVRIDDHVSIQETERYIQELSEEEEDDEPHSEHLPHTQSHDLENHSLHSESFSFASDSVLATGKQPKKSGRFSKVRRLFRRRRYGARQHDDAQSLPDSFTNTSLKHSLEQVPQPGSANQQQQQVKLGTKTEEEAKNGGSGEPIYVHSKSPRCFPIMKKLKSMADRQKKRLNIKRIHLGKDDKIVLNEEPKILKLKNSPKSQRSDIPRFIEKQDSDDVLEIVQLDESPSRKRRDDEDADYVHEEERTQQNSSIVKPEEIIEIKDIQTKQADSKDDNEEADKKADEVDAAAVPPKKAPRLRREHVYEEIDQPDEAVAAAEELKFILDATSVDAIKQSLVCQDTNAIKEVATTKNNIPLDRMGSSEEEAITLTDRATPERKSNSLLAPISSIDSASSDEDRSKLHLQPVAEEEADQEPQEEAEEETSSAVPQQQQINLAVSGQETEPNKPSLKKEASPAPSEKKVTFSHVEDEAEPHREDIELAAEQLEAAKEANKWKNTLK